MTNTINPFRGCEVAADWEWHLKHAKLSPIPGTDYRMTPGTPIVAAASGPATHSVGAQNQISIAVDGGRITYRELGALHGEYPRQVKQGEVIAYASKPKWPHIEFDRITSAGITYEPFEQHITPTTKPASTGTTTPVKGTTVSAPLVQNYKANPTSNHWFRTWEFTIEETTDAGVATQWKEEAGQAATITASGDDLNAQRAAVRTRIAGLAAALKG